MTDDRRLNSHPRSRQPQGTNQGSTETAGEGQADFGQFVSTASKRWSAREPEAADDPAGDSATESGGEPPPPPGDDKPGPPFHFNRNSLFLGLIALLTLVVSFAAFNQFRDTPEPSPTVEPTVQQTIEPTDVVVQSTEPPVPTASTEVLPTNTAEPTTEPTSDPNQSDLAMQCESSCLVRIAASEPAYEVIEQSGYRPSHQAGDWIWVVSSRDLIAMLDVQGEAVTVIRDSPETLNFYIATLPEGQTDFSVLGGFGDIVDSVDRSAIVEVAEIPAQVQGITGAGVDILKFAPAVPTSVENVPDGNVPVLTTDQIGGLAAEVSTDEITNSIVELQATSSTDGTGIGSRQYLQPGNVMSAEYLYTRLESYGFTVRYEDFITPEGTLASNVIAELPGRDDSAIYGVMAHFDSMSEQFSVAPGADDNATGVAGALEIARVLGQYDLQFGVHIIFVNAEETGIIGSRVFARNAVAAGVPYEGIFNLDAVGSDRNGRHFWLNSDSESEWMMALMIRVNENYGLGQNIEARINPNIVADDNRLRDEGLESVLITRELFGTSPNHHTSDDVIENMSIPNTVSATQLMLLTLASLVAE
ncbi:MAG: M20/M25/M40 family metallo-hydrolase [Thermomicrobiales bacterium]